MKTLVLNGSPRKSGDTVAMISELTRHLEGEVRIISAYHDRISPCVDCRYCWENDGCAINDGMQEVYQAMKEYDNVIIASPIHYSQLTGQLLGLFSRFQCYYAAKKFRGSPVELKRKNGGLILAGGGDGSEKAAIDMACLLFKVMNVNFIGSVTSLNTNETPACEDETAKRGARELAFELNRLHACAE